MIKWVQRQWRAIAGGFAEREGVIEPVSGQAIIFAGTRKLTTTAYTHQEPSRTCEPRSKKAKTDHKG